MPYRTYSTKIVYLIVAIFLSSCGEPTELEKWTGTQFHLCSAAKGHGAYDPYKKQYECWSYVAFRRGKPIWIKKWEGAEK